MTIDELEDRLIPLTLQLQMEGHDDPSGGIAQACVYIVFCALNGALQDAKKNEDVLRLMAIHAGTLCMIRKGSGDPL